MELPEISEGDSDLSTLIAMSIRNAMEDFHAENLTDSQMAELNPLIREGIVTALHAITNADKIPAKEYLWFQSALIPGYWEEPELSDDYKELWGDPDLKVASL